MALRVPTLPLPEAGNVQGCVACYDVTEDWVPIYDKSSVPGRGGRLGRSGAGFYMAIGTSGNQFKNAGVAGRLMRELVEASLKASNMSRKLFKRPGSPALTPMQRLWTLHSRGPHLIHFGLHRGLEI